MTIILTPYWSKGVQRLKPASPPPEKLRHGLVPSAFNEGVHAERALAQLRGKDQPLEKYIFLSRLKSDDPDLFYKLCLENMAEITPIIYTPTVGDACIQFSHIYRRPEGLWVSIKDKGNIKNVLNNWPKIDKARISVVTDGSRILGLGDLGVNGMGISIGKLSLYVAGAGILPQSTIPICLDLGTNNQAFLEDPFYLGLRQKRVSEQEMDEFMDEFMHEMTQAFPKMMIQFEDFSTDKAFRYLERYRHQYPVFNDDIQGTGAVVLSGLMNAAKLSSAASGMPLNAHRILFFGAGSAGVGVATQLQSFFTLQGLSVEEARRRIWLIDSQGLVYESRGRLAEHKKYFARDDYSGPPMTDILDIIDLCQTYRPPRPVHHLGEFQPFWTGFEMNLKCDLHCHQGAFTPEVLQLMAAINPRPIIFPLSNPVRLSECSFNDAVVNTNGTVLFASGSPFPEQEFVGRVLYPGQGNNMYIFPGLGLGAILSRATQVTDSMVEASSLGLANSLTEEEHAAGLLYPRVERIREISAHIAVQVIRAAQKANVTRSPELAKMDDSQLHALMKRKMWNPSF
ncbi:malate dehydrogenase [Ephemerocybe angulata]|uniref:Malic enzyme n=1 Tax=Ephemerocybe angulata TaxID=980116 RepID=A0A8H6IGV3_9AGAR|nr:malate dehydrogenase [Tulosesus angulatus]